MKSKLLMLLTAGVMVVSMLSGCGGEKKANYILATGGTSGTYYPLGGAMCQIISEKGNNINITAQSSGASVENCKLMNVGESEFAIVQNDMVDYAYNGTEVFTDGKLENIRLVASLYPEVIQLVVSADSDINDIADLKGKKVSVGAAGSGIEANVRQIFEVAGLNYDEMVVSYLSFSESADSFKDNHIDAFFVASGIPNSAVQDIAAQNKIKLVSLSDDLRAKLIENYQFFSEAVVPAGTYNNQTEDAKSVAIKAVLAVSKDISDDTVYDVTKILFENQAELASAHAKGAEISLETALDGLSIPIHPGAEKYYKETGVIE